LNESSAAWLSAVEVAHLAAAGDLGPTDVVSAHLAAIDRFDLLLHAYVHVDRKARGGAGSLAGTVVPPGPSDPLKARFMSFDGGAGIHGIDPSEYGTIGHTASHGCIRMTIPDVIDLYSKVSVGVPVYII